MWNPLPWFDTVREDHQLGDIAPLHDFFKALARNALPSVSWIAPADKVSDHPPSLLTNGQAYVTGLIDSIMRSKAWNSTAIFLCWDDLPRPPSILPLHPSHQLESAPGKNRTCARGLGNRCSIH
jgi:hypothetical protein